MKETYPGDYPRSLEEAAKLAASVTDDEIDYSEIPEVQDFSNWRPVGDRIKKMAEHNLAVLSQKLKVG